MKSKITDIKTAVNHIKDGAMVAVGGMTNYRRPVGLVLEIINQEKRHLVLLTMSAGLESDILLGSGCVDVIRTCYAGLEIFGLSPMFRHRIENGDLRIIEETETTLAAGLRAKLGTLAFLPARCLSGTDLISVRPDIRKVTCPYTGEQLPALPALKPDVALIHTLAADEQGNAILGGNRAIDLEIAQAAKVTIVSTEKVVSHKEIVERGADIIGFDVDYVVPARLGAYPTSCYPDYFLDGRMFVEYIKACNGGRFHPFVKELFRRVNESLGSYEERLQH
jgi:glutaconate CoA-transferase, subunit A